MDVKKEIIGRTIGACCASAFLFAAAAVAQEQSGDWRLTGARRGTDWLAKGRNRPVAGEHRRELQIPLEDQARAAFESGAVLQRAAAGRPPDQCSGLQRHRVLEFRGHSLRRGLGVGCNGLDERIQIIIQSRAGMRSLQPADTDGAADCNQFQRPAAARSRSSEAT